MNEGNRQRAGSQMVPPLLGSDGSVIRIGQITGEIDRLERVVLLGRRMRWLLPGFALLALGFDLVTAGGWTLLIRAGLILAVGLGFIEVVSRWYSRRIEVLEAEVASLLRSAS